MSEKRFYRISIQRWCGEFVCGRISQEFYAYWKDKDADQLANHIIFIDSDQADPDSPPVRAANAPDAWFDLDDVAHISGALVDNNFVHVTEVFPSDEEISGWKDKEGGYSESFELSAIRQELPDDFTQTRRVITLKTDIDSPENPVVMIKSLEKGEQTIAVCTSDGAFDLAKLRFQTWDVDGDKIIASVLYDGEDLEISGDWSEGKGIFATMGDLSDIWSEGNEATEVSEDASEPPVETDQDIAVVATPGPAPSRLSLFLSTLWPSFRRTLTALLTVLGLPLFVLAVISTVKYLNWMDLVNLRGFAEQLIGAQQHWLEQAVNYVAAYGVHVPSWIVDSALVFLSIGNTAARAEKTNLLAVDTSDTDRWQTLKDGLTQRRFELLALAQPRWLRNVFVRLGWPFAMLHRLKTPFVVEGPGPSGDDISSSVPRRELKDFAKMVSDAIGWKGQTVFDVRQIYVWHFAILALSSFASAHVLSRLP